MAKNKKKFSYNNLKVNEEDLSITKIGEIATSEKSPLFVLLFFAILLLFIFFLPTIVDYIKGENKTNVNKPIIINPEEKPNSDENIDEMVYYNFSSSLSISLEENIKIDHFALTNNILSFTITNSGETKFYFSKRNYFVEIYTEDKTLLERIILSKDSIAKASSMDFSYEISASTAINMKKIVFVEKEIADYPNIDLVTNESNEEILICKKDVETITYKFQNQKLSFITDVLNYTRTTTDTSYETKLNEWKSKVAIYNNIGGVSSTFIDAGNGFIVNTVLDLANVKIANLNNENYYEYETLAKVVKFEMEARGFSCN